MFKGRSESVCWRDWWRLRDRQRALGWRNIAQGISTGAQSIEVRIQAVDLFLERSKMRVHLLEFLGLLESICAAIRRILAFEVKVSTSLARCVSIAFDLAPLALIAGLRQPGTL